MENITLRELCERFNVSRRAVQGYEAMKLVSPTGRNDRGHLLYDELAQERVQQIKELQQFGFQLKEIAEMIDAENEVKKATLQRRAAALESEFDKMEQTIKRIWEVIEAL